jgi:Mor family transcriptional regulator
MIDKRTIRKLRWAENWTPEQLVKEFNCPIGTINKILIGKCYSKDVPKCFQSEMIKLYNSGNWTYAELADKYDLSIGTINKILRENGAKKKNVGAGNKLFTEEQVEEIRRRKWQSGWTLAELADEYKCSTGTIGKIVNKE